MVSCLMVTQDGREQTCAESIAGFSRQSCPDKELVIVHDGTNRFHSDISNIVDRYRDCEIRMYQQRPGLSLGVLRNISIQHARHPLVCQWDDDDYYHPERLARQLACLRESGSDFCFLTDQLHLFTQQRYLFWDDWSVENYPGNLIQGTIFGKKALIGEYPDVRIGEDTEITFRLINAGYKIAQLAEFGWLYIYTYNGDNAWDLEHHKAISQWKRLKHDRLKAKLDLLERELPRFELPFDSLLLPHERGVFEINPASGAQ